jgi:NitT/TauT family transport system substrate-binding protein
MRIITKTLFAGLIALALITVGAFGSSDAHAQAKKDFKIAWSIYVGWMPWDYADKHGILKKWADKYAITIELTQINDYVESINQYTAGKFDGCVMTNMDALSIPAVGGVDTTALIIGDFSNGNDGIVSKTAKTVAQLKGKKINLVELSVSHYLLARALESAKLAEKDITVVNTSDADMVAAYQSRDVTSAVTWNPLLSEIMNTKGTSLLYTSASIPGEIIDMMVVNADTLKDNPNLGKALVGAWYETIGIMQKEDAKGNEARTYMAEKSGTDLAGFNAQLKSTRMFYAPYEAVGFAAGKDLPATMDVVRKFLFDHGIYGDAKSPDQVGMTFPDGSTLGDKANTKLRFDATYMKMAADGKL